MGFVRVSSHEINASLKKVKCPKNENKIFFLDFHSKTTTRV